MSNAPVLGMILHVRGRDASGRILEPMHYACGGGEEQPPFEGWFVPYKHGEGFYQVQPVEWQPLSATYDDLTAQSSTDRNGRQRA